MTLKVDLTDEGLAQGNFLKLTVEDKLRDAQAYLRDGQLTSAMEKISEALLADPKRADVLATFAELADRRGSPHVAVAVAEAAVTHNPQSSDAHIGLVQRYVRTGRHAEAIRAAGDATRLSPNHSGAWLCLADLLLRRDRVEEGVAACRAALDAANVSETEALRAVAWALDSGRADEARAVAEAAHRAFPQHTPLAVLFGQACLAAGAPSEALALARGIRPGNYAADVACIRARAEIDCGQPVSAVRTLDAVANPGERAPDVAALRAVALRLSGDARRARKAYADAIAGAGNVSRLHLGHAITLRALGLPREALATLDRADTAQGGATGSSLVERADVLRSLGRRAAANEAMRHAAETGVDGDLMDGPALLDGDLEPDLAPEGLRYILDHGLLGADERIGYRFALGHAENACGRPSAAMRAWHAANAEVRARYRFDVDGLTAWLRRIPSVVRDWTAAPAREPVPDAPRPIFIVGMPRSGTSLVEHTLAAHPAVWAGGEMDTVLALIDDLSRCSPDAGYPDVIARLGDGELADLRRHLLTQLASRFPGAEVVTDKLPGNFAHLGWLVRLLPDAVIVDCRRDYRDTALSLYTQWFRDGHLYAYDLGEIGRVLRAHADVMAAWEATVTHPGWFTLAYEDLVSAPESTIARLLTGCGLSHADACFAAWRHIRHVSSGSARRVTRPISDDRVGRWRSHADALTGVRANFDGL